MSIQAVHATPGAIGYVEKGFADQAGLPFAQIDTGNGGGSAHQRHGAQRRQPANFVAGGNDLVLDLNAMYGTQDPNVYPLVMATYEIVCSKGYDAGHRRGDQVVPQRGRLQRSDRSFVGRLRSVAR